MFGMNEPDSNAAGSPANPPSRSTRPAAAARGGSIALALLLALVALLAAGYVGWRQWQQRQHQSADAGTLAALQQRVSALEASMGSANGGRESLAQRLATVDQTDRALQAAQQAHGDRLRLLEEAVGKLSDTTLSAHDGVLLDETESLLRMAKERYELFHDARGAAAAYALAAQTLGAVSDASFASLRQSIETERRALLASQPVGQAEALDQITTLRNALPSWPLKPIDAMPTSTSGAWLRITHALAGVVTVQRDNGTPLEAADARFARELVAIDLAQAQAALLAHDPVAWKAALQRADNGLANGFDTTSEVVQQARATLKHLAGALPKNTPVPLGAALAELRNLRAVHAISSSPAGAASAPAPAASVGAAR